MSPRSRWLVRRAPDQAARVRLFCLPYAGGNAYMFRAWSSLLPPSVDVIAVQLPGRGSNIEARPFTRMEPLAEALAAELAPYLDLPFALFGHSMGAMLGFEVARLLRRAGRRAPVHLFVSGRRAPQIADDTPPTFELPDREFVEELRRLKGTPQEVLQHDELMTLMIPVLRADFAVCQTYVYRPEPPLDSPITAFCGMRDEEETSDRMAAWAEQTTSSFSLNKFSGDHFFLTAAAPRMLATISRALEDAAREPAPQMHEHTHGGAAGGAHSRKERDR